ncbi:AAA family ATPase [Gemmobacter aquarius]|uniref:AAA family ATPase n=1 Tax=Paragemmobacter aquarius TaxID=2169400 RepID=A0A2S0UK01_9RHOB|nr:AAA family ATPase [Gemmobacter aquarius]AWB48139.1 AAA family ATPase [Gemmobacter aquarius]
MTDFPHPAAPLTPEDTGLNADLLIGLALKFMKSNGVLSTSQLADALCLSRPIIRSLTEDMVRLQLVEARGLSLQGDLRSDLRFALTDRGDARAEAALAVSQYIGPAPVPLEAFVAQAALQTVAAETIRQDRLHDALSHLVLPPGLTDRLGPAVNSAASVLFYGEAGNGKTSIAEALATTFQDTILVPYAFVVRNEIIQVFDDTVHIAAGDDAGDHLDRRWVRCRRPIIAAGGELTLAKLDLIFEPHARFYEAPMHLKALGGMFLIDDFGRQKEPPMAFINRWIGPLERGYDILTLHTGKKFGVPFDLLLLFSTNMPVEAIADSAGLRRITFKLHVPSPTRDEYLEIFRRTCERRGIAYDASIVEAFFDDTYAAQSLVTSGAHPGFLLKHVIAASSYLGRPPSLTRDLLDLAWQNVISDRRPPVAG